MAKKSENLLFGIRAILEKIKAGEELEKVLLQKNLKGDLMQELKSALRDANIPTSMVPVEKLNRLTRKNHQGAVAFTSPVKYYPLNQIVLQAFESGQQPFLLMLDGVTDVRNFGSIARTAECMGVHAIVIPVKGNAQINADAIKTSAGALHYIPVCREPNLELSAQYLKSSGIQMVACTEKGDTPIENTDLSGPICLIMGAEDVGISPELLNACDRKVQIPISGNIESLNVGAATAMMLFECRRQRSD